MIKIVTILLYLIEIQILQIIPIVVLFQTLKYASSVTIKCTICKWDYHIKCVESIIKYDNSRYVTWLCPICKFCDNSLLPLIPPNLRK